MRQRGHLFNLPWSKTFSSFDHGKFPLVSQTNRLISYGNAPNGQLEAAGDEFGENAVG
jgi:hypothetical protein